MKIYNYSFVQLICLRIFLLKFSLKFVASDMQVISDKNSTTTYALSEIMNNLQINYLIILFLNETDNKQNDHLIKLINHNDIQTCIFFNIEHYFNHIDENIKGSIETTSLLFVEPDNIIKQLISKNLAHRLSLYIFFWGATEIPIKHNWPLSEPLRSIMLIHTKKNIFRIYYNQASSDGYGNLKLINWYDANTFGIRRIPVLPSSATVYKNFNKRIFYIPVIHSPPWFFIVYANQTNRNKSYCETCEFFDPQIPNTFNVYGGRDDSLLKLLSQKMNFDYVYIDPPERTQGSLINGDENNLTYSGGLGMLQRSEADMLFGDIAITLERRKIVEFSFFTLADSGAFVTHSPRPLNEALALIRPFRLEIWPPLILTIIISGPVFYFIILAPLWLEGKPANSCNTFRRKNHRHLFLTCIWFTLTIFLRQVAVLPCNSQRTRFFAGVLWLAATYVLGDVYLAQLTSQLAKPATESTINTLYKLEYAMKYKNYQLYVERQSASFAILENGTGIFNRLYNVMKQQNKYKNFNETYLVPSIEAGVRHVMNDKKNVILGGRETLYYNIKRYGLNKFHLSEKLYTRYSAIAVQIGCPYLDSLNHVLMRLFEAGILEKITNSEYEKMFKATTVNSEEVNTSSDTTSAPTSIIKTKSSDKQILEPIKLKMLQGIFYILISGYILSFLSLLIEIKIYKN